MNFRLYNYLVIKLIIADHTYVIDTHTLSSHINSVSKATTCVICKL